MVKKNDTNVLEFLKFVRFCINETASVPNSFDKMDWFGLFCFMKKQALLGVGFCGLERIRKEGIAIPRKILLQWYAVNEKLQESNVKMNHECTRLTHFFESEGHCTAILKGQANARLYPNPLSRQPGDIDIWVDGGFEGIISLLDRLETINVNKNASLENVDKACHHIHLLTNESKINVEIHFRPSSGNWNPFSNRRVQKFLNKEIAQENKMVEEGFRIPSLRFALIMQLAHIQRHFLDVGIGFRQVMDYYYLLKSNDVVKKKELVQLLRNLGLWNMAKAMMWVLYNVFGLEEKYMIAPMDKRRGNMLLDDILSGGNFGHHSIQIRQNALGRFFLGRIRHVKLLFFDVEEVLGFEYSYWKKQIGKGIDKFCVWYAIFHRNVCGNQSSDGITSSGGRGIDRTRDN